MIKTLKYSTINGASGLYSEELFFDNELKGESNKQLDPNDKGTDTVTKLRAGVDNDIQIFLDGAYIGGGEVPATEAAIEGAVADAVTEETEANFVDPEVSTKEPTVGFGIAPENVDVPAD